MSDRGGQSHHLTPEERARVQMQVDHFIEILERRYGLEAADVVSAIRWVQDRKDRNDKLSNAGAIGLIGLIISSLAIGLMEAVKAWWTAAIK